MKKIIFVILLLSTLSLLATHNRAGEITYRQINELTYEITLITYTYTPSAANETRDNLPISWGDNTSEMIPRVSVTLLPDNYTKNVYKTTHVYPGPGIYFIVMEDPNRNDGVHNIPGSVNVVFSVATTLKIDANVGFNTTPVLMNPPLDKAIVGQTFIHNPAAYDEEGDSISYELTVCRRENGEPIPDYSLPPSSHSFTVDAVTGDLIWDAPVDVGTYNVAMLIEEWREGIKIGQIIRDMQIEVLKGNDIKPEIDSLPNFCVEAGQDIKFAIKAMDGDGDKMRLEYTGGPFLSPPIASVTTVTDEEGFLSADFFWNTSCEHIRLNPYQAVFKVIEENRNPSLVDFGTSQIKVVPPAPKNLTLSPAFNSINLSWEGCPCSGVVKYHIYRKISFSGWTPSSCQVGIPSGIGFEKIATIDDGTLFYTDNNDGMGLNQGFNYCYRVVGEYADFSLSYASEEVCTELELGYPLITKVSVDSTDERQGRIDLHWAPFYDFDTVSLSGPYVYLIYQSNDLVGGNLSLIDSTFSLTDTIYVDDSINTEGQVYSYSIELYNNELGNRQLIGKPQLASSLYLELSIGDNKIDLKVKKNTPWINDTMVVYRMNSNASEYDSIGYSLNNTYEDVDLVNGQTYCYYVKTIGHYPPDQVSYSLINFSQEVCAQPIDEVAPCSPKTKVVSFCEEYYNEVTWSIPDSCKEDVLQYHVYYTPVLDGDMDLIFQTNHKKDTVFLHYPEESIAGCYSVTAVDSFGNESPIKSKICVDNCTYYELPNIFTPNGDGHNDLVIPGPYRFVDKVDMKIYNRWGVLVFQTEDPDIEWDGKYMENNKFLTPGVYYYVCDVYEHRLTGIEVRVLTGFIQLLGPDEFIKE